jgi:hypothetical protein
LEDFDSDYDTNSAYRPSISSHIRSDNNDDNREYYSSLDNDNDYITEIVNNNYSINPGQYFKISKTIHNITQQDFDEIQKDSLIKISKLFDENLSYKKTHPFIGWVFLLSEVFFHAFEKAFFAFARLGFKIGRCL